MFDSHSLIKLHSRLAAEGEELIAHKFGSGVLAMVPRTAFDQWRSRRLPDRAPQDQTTVWQSIQSCWRDFLRSYGYVDSDADRPGDEPQPVVAIPSEALLRVFGISQSWQDRYHFDSFEDALFIEKAGLCFGNGITIPLQALPEGQQVKVLHRWWADSLDPSPSSAARKR